MLNTTVVQKVTTQTTTVPQTVLQIDHYRTTETTTVPQTVLQIDHYRATKRPLQCHRPLQRCSGSDSRCCPEPELEADDTPPPPPPLRPCGWLAGAAQPDRGLRNMTDTTAASGTWAERARQIKEMIKIWETQKISLHSLSLLFSLTSP